ncbi:hypothetical protein P9D43_20950 [Neobacillus niacini]|uniref:hypothetical protein n=1 Tax=Neobacillus niacini TaxID=86668 RepID=UPI0007AB3D5E|nr:hypothetical protein [Neobacillus niacini]MEC1524475.1 hypothetical protein [Neobacillus niacini]
MYSVQHGIQFARTLTEKSCLVSRLHLKGVERSSYFTLHQIAWKILRRQHNAEIVKKLAGDEMIECVTEALKLTFGTEPDEQLVSYYYFSIRDHKNNLEILKTLPHGQVILTNYQKVLKDNFDWEDSLQTATWYLKNNMVNALYEFSYENIILVQSELLLLQRNKNAMDFFNAWCTWMEEYTRCNAFLVNNYGYIFKFQNGAFESYGHIANLYRKGDIPFDLPAQPNLRFNLQQSSNNDGCFF